MAGAPPPYEAYADPNAAPPPYAYTVTTRVRNRAKNPIVFRARFFVHFMFQSCTIVHEKCTIFFVLNKKIVQNRASSKPYYFALELTYNNCGCIILVFYE